MCFILSSSDVAEFFKPSSTAIKRAILEQRSSAHKKIVVRALRV